MSHDDDCAAEMGIPVEEFRSLRASAFAKIRRVLRDRRHRDVPDSDEGLYLYLERIGLAEQYRRQHAEEATP